MDLIKHLTHILTLKENWEKESYAIYRSVTDIGLNFNINGGVESILKYEQIYNKYCTKNIKKGGEGFSNPPRLAINSIEISLIEESNTKATCKIQPKSSSSHFLYKFKFQNGEWLIDKIVRVDVTGKENKHSF